MCSVLPNNRFESNKDEFVRRVHASVVQSLHRVHEPQPESNPLVFTEPKPAHEDVIRRVLNALPVGEQKLVDLSTDAPTDNTTRW